MEALSALLQDDLPAVPTAIGKCAGRMPRDVLEATARPKYPTHLSELLSTCLDTMNIPKHLSTFNNGCGFFARCRPESLEDYRERLATFKAFLWFDTTCSAMDCAKHGWQLRGAERIGCDVRCPDLGLSVREGCGLSPA